MLGQTASVTMNNKRIIAELNRIARAELSGPKRHRHNWQTDQPLTRGTAVTFGCECGKSKTVRIPTIDERKAELERKFFKRR